MRIGHFIGIFIGMLVRIGHFVIMRVFCSVLSRPVMLYTHATMSNGL